MKCPRKLPLAFHANCLASEKNVKICISKYRLIKILPSMYSVRSDKN